MVSGPRKHYRENPDYARYQDILCQEYNGILTADETLVLRLKAISALRKIESDWESRGGDQKDWRHTPDGWKYITKAERLLATS